MTGSASDAVSGSLFGTEAWLDVLYSHVAGIDVHKKPVTVTVRTPDPRRAGRREKTRTSARFTRICW